jgi:hypothetical protein
MSLVKIPIFDVSFCNDGYGTLTSGRSSFPIHAHFGGPMADRQERFVNLLGRAAMDVWGDMPRDIQERWSKRR